MKAGVAKIASFWKETIGKLPTNCLSVFDHFVGLFLKRLMNNALYFFFLGKIYSHQMFHIPASLKTILGK